MEESCVCTELQEMLAKNDYKKVLAHVESFCYDCAVKRLARKPHEEVLWTDGPPPWLRPDEEAEEVEGQNSSTASTSRKKNKKATENSTTEKKILITPEDIDDHLLQYAETASDGLLQFEVLKYKGVSKEDAREIVVDIRRKLHMAKKDMEEVPTPKLPINKKVNLPWCPPIREIFPLDPLSEYLDTSQTRIVSILFNLICTGTMRHEPNRADIKRFVTQTEKERRNLESMIVEEFNNKYKGRLEILAASVRDFVLNRWRARWEKGDYFYNTETYEEIPLSIVRSSSGLSRPECISVVLPGRPERLQLPDLRTKCFLQAEDLLDHYPLREANIFPISEDSLARELCVENNIPVVMDASTACTLMNEPLNEISNYCISVTVTSEVFRGISRNVIVLSKPQLFGTVEKHNIRKTYLKYLFKSAFVRHRRRERLERYEAQLQRAEIEDSDTENAAVPSTSVDDKVGSILDAIKSTEAEGEAVSSKSNNTGKRYTIFSFGEQRVLLRANPAMICSSTSSVFNEQLVSMEPFIEYVPQVGAMKRCVEEIFRSHCKVILKQAEKHCIVRMFPERLSGHVLQLQPLLPDFYENRAEMEMSLKTMMNESTCFVDNLLGILQKKGLGRYLLLKEGGSELKLLDILPKEQLSDSPSFSIKQRQNHIRCKEESNFGSIFQGIDPRVVLQWQVVQKRAPGCCIAPDSSMLKNIDLDRLKNGNKTSEQMSTLQRKGNLSRGQKRKNKRKLQSQEMKRSASTS